MGIQCIYTVLVEHTKISIHAFRFTDNAEIITRESESQNVNRFKGSDIQVHHIDMMY